MYYITFNNKNEQYEKKEEALERFSELCHNAKEHSITFIKMIEKVDKGIHSSFNHMFTYHPA